MQKPPYRKPYSDRHLDCQFAMEDHFVDLMEAAAAAGWTAADATAAVIDLAGNYMLKLHSVEETARQIAGAVDRAGNEGRFSRAPRFLLGRKLIEGQRQGSNLHPSVCPGSL
jgi:hypothetical protein